MRASATRNLRNLTLALAAVMAPAAAQAQQAPSAANDAGGELGVRLGYGLPMGERSQGVDLDTGITGQIPVIFDAGYRFNPNVYAGVGLGYGFAQIKNNDCDGPNVSCSASIIRLGLNLLYRFAPEQRFAPFIGLGAGYEWFRFQGDTTAVNLGGSYTVSGFEFANFQFGGDYRLSANSVIGPFLNVSVGRYDNVSTKLTTAFGTTTVDGDIDDTALHEWVLLGIRGAFSL